LCVCTYFPLGQTEAYNMHSFIYSIMWIVLVMVMALSGASGINMSIRLGRLDHKGAKQAGYVGICMSSLVCFAISIAVWFKIRYFGMIFSNDTVFLDLFESAKTPFTVTLLLMNIAMAIEKVPYSMGRTTEVFWYGLIASWGGKPLARDIIYRVLFRFEFQFS
jgi:Na+-driven multidrug efflux pump